MGRGVFRFRERDAAKPKAFKDPAALAEVDLVEPPQVLPAARELLRQTPPMSDRDETIFLLHTAAEIEHSLLAQYLYAAYSLNPVGQQAEWREALLLIAREEMAHLLSIQNLLRVLGGPLNFEREDYPFNVLYPFPFQLERFTLKSIARYVLAEMPEPSTIPPQLGFDIDQVKHDAEVTEPGETVNRVGALFALLLKLVDKLIDQPAGEAERPDFRPETAKLQAHPDEGWVFDDMILSLVQNKSEARTLVERIGKQGEGPGELGDGAKSHFRRFFKIYSEMKASPAEAESRVVPTNPTTQEPAEGEADPNFISAKLSRAWADLFNSRYRLLLADLAHILTLSVDDQAQAISRVKIFGWIFTEMSSNLASIAEILATSPRHDPPQFKDVEQKVLIAAGPPFSLPYTLQLPDQPIDRWRQYEQLLTEAAQQIANVKKALQDPHPLLKQMLDQDNESLKFVHEQIKNSPQ